MSIGKPKNDPIDLNGLMNEIENDHRITVESDAIDKHIEELRAAQKDLRQATETLEKATMTLNGAIAALKSATDNSTNIVTGINNAIVKAQENTEYKVSIAQEDMELLMKNSQAVLATDEIVMKQHFEKQAQAMESHERRISSILNRNQGFWISDFWAKVFIHAAAAGQMDHPRSAPGRSGAVCRPQQSGQKLADFVAVFAGRAGQAHVGTRN